MDNHQIVIYRPRIKPSLYLTFEKTANPLRRLPKVKCWNRPSFAILTPKIWWTIIKNINQNNIFDKIFIKTFRLMLGTIKRAMWLQLRVQMERKITLVELASNSRHSYRGYGVYSYGNCCQTLRVNKGYIIARIFIENFATQSYYCKCYWK